LSPPRKPPNRLWLYGPYLALALVVVLWSGAWLLIRSHVAAAFDAAAAQSRAPRLAWDHRRIGGYPFRIEVVLDGARATWPSGWSLAAQQVRAETYAYDLKHWVAYAPQGVVLNRPGAGQVAITGKAVRASVAAEANQTRVSVEGLDVAFKPQAGAKPFPILWADHIDAHVRPAGADKTEFLFQLQGARLSSGGLLGRLSQGAPLAMAWHGTLSKASAFAGRDWPDAGRAWTVAGGQIDLLGGGIETGAVGLDAVGGQLSVGPDGRLRGVITLDASHGDSLVALGRAVGIGPDLTRAAAQIAANRTSLNPGARADITFQAGAVTFGPIALGAAPRIY
jgi:hypothetical protein